MALNLNLDVRKLDIQKNKQLFIGIAMAVVALWIGFNYIYKPGMNNLKRLNEELNNESANKEIAKRLSVYQNVFAGQKKYFGRNSDVLWLMDTVSQAANKAGLKIVSLNAQPQATCSYFSVNSVNLVVSGTFHQMGDFVASIESIKGFVRIERLFFTKNSTELSATVTISTYFLK